MRSTFHGLEVAKRGLYGQQTAISTTGHNIANANTEGYTRQKVDLASSLPIEMSSMQRSHQAGQLGTGVDVERITRVRENFLDEQYRNEQELMGSWEVKKETLEKIELLFNVSGEGSLNSVIDQFYSAWQDLSTDPTSSTARAVVVERAESMLDGFKYMDNQLNGIQSEITSDLNGKVSIANTNLEQIAHLNKEISRIEGLGNNANDLRDKRDVLVDELSKITSIKVVEDSNGMLTISNKNGDKLVDKNNYKSINTDIPLSDLSGGEIEGLLVSRDEIVEKYKSHLNSMLDGMVNGEVSIKVPEGSILAEDVSYLDSKGDKHTISAGQPIPSGGIITQVDGINGVHKLGWTLSESGGNAKSGESFFILDNNNGDFNVRDLKLNSTIKEDVNNIASSFKVENINGQTKSLDGNSDLAVTMGQLKYLEFNYNATSLTPASTGSFNERLRDIIGVLGVDTQQSQRQVENQEVILHSIDNRRQSVSGVSLDEEMSNLIKYQHAYNASARMLTTQDELLDMVVNRMGRVGL